MSTRPNTVMRTFLSVEGSARVLAAVAATLFAVGCGTYEPEPEYPQTQYVAAEPPEASELAAEQESRRAAVAESREVILGVDDSEYADTDPTALTEFKPVLHGHGDWVEDASYGTVWVPSRAEVGADFQPYVTAGHWTYSDATDYVWVSDYSWGWAPFHYGRWVHLPVRGWAWIPGRRYAGAWVTWRVGPSGYGYVGWAPAPPAYYWYNGVALAWTFGWYDYHAHYVYCPRTHLYRPSVGGYVVRGPAAREHYGRTQDYVPARPGVGGGERVVARPEVGGAGHVAAKPSVGGPSEPAPGHGRRGPRPDELGVKNDVVVAPPASNEGLTRAQAFATPSTAIEAGAAAPAHFGMPSTDVARVSPVEGAASIGPFRSAPSAGAGAASSSWSSPAGRSTPPVATPGAAALPSRGYADPARPGAPPPFRYSEPARPSAPPTFRYSEPARPSVPPTFRTAPSPAVRPSAPPTFRTAPSPAVRPSVPPTFRTAPSPAVRPSAPPTFRTAPSPVFRAPSRPSVSPSFRAPSRPSVSPSFRAPSRPSVSPSFRASPRSSSSFGSSRSSRPRISAPAVRGTRFHRR